MKRIALSEARKKLTRLEELIEPGEEIEITKRSKRYARIKLIGGKNRAQEILASIEQLPEGGESDVAQNYKRHLYGR